jgi:F-type H+-transporting ATPase subunit a
MRRKTIRAASRPGTPATNRMGLEFLSRVRSTAAVAGFVVALFAATYFSYAAGIGVAAGVAWSIANLALLQSIVLAMTGTDRRRGATITRAALGMGGTAGLLGLAAWLLPHLSLAGVTIGFTLPFAVMVLKATSSMLLASATWRRFTASAWRPALLVALALGAVFALSNLATGTLRAAPVGKPAMTLAQAGEPAHGAAGTGEGHGAATAAEGGAGKDEGPAEFPTLVGVIARAGHGTAWGAFLHHNEAVVYSLLVALLVCVVLIAAASRHDKVPGGFINAIEYLVETLSNFVCDILGPRYGPRFVPFLGSLFIYIWTMNLFGIIPLMKSPTSSLNVTLALALTVVLYVHFIAIRELGFIGWLDHLAGSPRSVIDWCLVPLMFPIHVIGELAKPVSLSCRLFGNIFGEDMLLVGFASLGITALSALHVPFGIPLQFPFLFLALMTSTIQALVFTMLSTIYFLLMLPHDDHGHGHEGEAHHAH